MKRVFISIISILIATASFAETVSLKDASLAASQFFTKTRSAAKVTLAWDGNDSKTKSGAEAPAFYVFNNEDGGWVVLSAENTARPVLAFSNEGTFSAENLPVRISEWFNIYKGEISLMRSRGALQSSQAKAQWDKVSKGAIRTYSSVKELKTPCWGQGSPFNTLCPRVDNEQSVTGCVNTAIAEIMYYHRWPSKGNGTLPDYSYTTDQGKQQEIKGHELTETYNYDAMLSSYKGYYSKEAGDAVARLMYDIGVMMKSSYNGTDKSSGTGAYTEDVPERVVTYMDFDSSAIMYYRDEFTTSQWTSMLKAEIDAGRPVLYSGGGPSGGHAFVMDGYATDDYFYINWGWSGTDNGFYHLSSFMVDSGYDFRYGQDATINLQKNKGGKPVSILNYFNSSSSGGGLKQTGGSFKKGSTVLFSVACLGNYSYVQYNDSVTIAIVDLEGRIKHLDEPSFVSIKPGYGKSFSCEITIDFDVALGDRIMMAFKRGEEWLLVKADPYYLDVLTDSIVAYDFPAIKFDPTRTYRSGDSFDLAIENAGAKYSVIWYLDNKKLTNSDGDNTPMLKLTSGTHTLKAVLSIGNRKETIIQTINVQ